MNETPTYQCYLGTVGWNHPEWQGPFYPEDLPTEWRLDFYNNTFDCVYLPYARWGTAKLDEIEGWLDETQDRFRFVLELNGPGLSESDKARIKKLGGKLGLVDDSGAKPDHAVLLWVDVNPDLKQLAQAIQDQIAAGNIVYLISRSPDLALLEQLRTLMEILGL
jgi:hypothetical protein